MALPLDRAILALPERAPKLIWLMYTGISRSIGLSAFFPMTVRMFTSLSASLGDVASWAPRNRMSSKFGTGTVVSMALSTLFPVSAIAWMSSITPPSNLLRFCGTSMLPSGTTDGAGSDSGSSARFCVDSSSMRTKADFGEWQRGQTQSSGRSSNLTPSSSSS